MNLWERLILADVESNPRLSTTSSIQDLKKCQGGLASFGAQTNLWKVAAEVPHPGT